MFSFVETAAAIEANGANVCRTADCVKIASRILNLMNATVNPCDNFYEFACGNFARNAIIPQDKLTLNIDMMVKSALQEELRTLLTDAIQPGDPAPFSAAKAFYKSCMNEAKIETDGIMPIVLILDKLGGWPVVVGDQWDSESNWNWQWAMKQFSRIGLPTDRLFKVNLDYNYVESSTRLIHVSKMAMNNSIGLISNLNLCLILN